MKNWMKKGFAAVAIVVVLVAGMSVAVAFAGGGSAPSNSVYGNAGANVQSTLGTSTNMTPPSGSLGTTTSASAPSTQLPFTGLDLGLVVVAGVVLLALGFSLRRLTRKPPAA